MIMKKSVGILSIAFLVLFGIIFGAGIAYASYCSGASSHEWLAATCQRGKKCKWCDQTYGSTVDHSYTKSCSKTHCSSKKCKWCGRHKNTCGGGCNSDGYCNHCVKSYCTKCGHTCTHNTDGKCEDIHCLGDDDKQNWCALCEKVGDYTHEHNPCSFTLSCSEAHCDSLICSLCGVHQKECGRDHIWGSFYKSVGDGATEDEIKRSDANHVRDCTVAGCDEKDVHPFSSSASWEKVDENTHKRTCDVIGCGLTQIGDHSFEIKAKELDNANNSHLYAHAKRCRLCSGLNAYEDEQHTDNGNGKCEVCNQLLWRAKTEGGEDITEYIKSKEHTQKEAVKEVKISIIEKLNENNIKYISEIWNAENQNELIQAKNNVLTITENGEYQFNTGRGGIGKFYIDYISSELILTVSQYNVVDPDTNKKAVIITISPNEDEKRFNKKIYIRQTNGSEIGDEEFNTNSRVVSDPDSWIEPWCTLRVEESGKYKFVAKDSVGNKNEIIIDVVIESGKATVAVSNNIFRNGYVFTDILINPSDEWNKGKVSICADIMKVLENGESNNNSEDIKSIHIVKILNSLREGINSGGNIQPGEYYLQITFGGNIFNETGTYIVNLKSVDLGNGNILEGQNRIVVNVLDYNDLT